MFWYPSCPQVFKKSLKRSTKSLKKSRKCTKGTQGPQVAGSQLILKNVLKFRQKVIKALEVLRGPQKVFKSTSIPQNVINVLKILWSSKVPQMVFKWSSQSPQMFLKTVLKCSTRSHQKFLKGSSMFWDPHVHRSSNSPQKGPQSPQKVKKLHKRYQGPQVSGSQMILKMSSISSKGPQIPRSPHRSTKGIQGDIKVPKKLSASSKSCGRQKFLKCSLNGPQKVLKSS